ncbi:hypothetical protein [Calothrix sp. UHCC 0171]|uniref:hypothetical protein n=1 Tax=Calothrix sp. UHCC 0171 TaxID=3110245 RepID=UPI002B21EB41|nr:hypothetical protein [Calothrix sp. UHCC 0171]MEA5571000.1 hypothetical protein [Calothrix sp. UHCC 0171]
MKKPILISAIFLGGAFLILYLCLSTSLLRARVIHVDDLIKRFSEQEAQNQLETFKNTPLQKITIQRGFNSDKGIDTRCSSWSVEAVGSGWTPDSQDHDFYVDYYVPPNTKAIICTTPALAGALTAHSDKPFLYEVYPTQYGLMIRIVIGISEVRDTCEKLTGNVNCANSLLKQQAIVRYEPL